MHSIKIDKKRLFEGKHGGLYEHHNIKINKIKSQL